MIVGFPMAIGQYTDYLIKTASLTAFRIHVPEVPNMDQKVRIDPRIVEILVLNEIGDDYEHFRRVRRGARKMAERMGYSITTKEISDAVVKLTRVGLAKAYYLSPWAPAQEVTPEVVASRRKELCETSDTDSRSVEDEENRPSLPHEDAHEPDKLYFLATEDGLTMLKAFNDWPPGVRE